MVFDFGAYSADTYGKLQTKSPSIPSTLSFCFTRLYLIDSLFALSFLQTQRITPELHHANCEKRRRAHSLHAEK